MGPLENKYADILQWQKTRDPKLLGPIVNKYLPILRSELRKYQGNLPPSTMEAYGKKYMIDALKNFDPAKANVTTHLVHNLQRLNRVNYDTSQVVRMSEELQRGVNVFKERKEYLTDKFGREPTIDELADELGWTESRIGRTERMLHSEMLSSGMALAPKSYEMEDPRLDYIYHDLAPTDKIIFQHKIGYKGSPILGLSDIAKKVKLSVPSISVRSKKIADLVKSKMETPTKAPEIGGDK